LGWDRISAPRRPPDHPLRLSPDSGWVSIATVDRESTLVINHVYDEGATWRVRFSGQARDGGNIEMSRADLENNGWRLTVPNDVADQLTNAGATASPEH
jgi:hypothetical protein